MSNSSNVQPGVCFVKAGVERWVKARLWSNVKETLSITRVYGRRLRME
jgi:hypothetical protein